MLRSTLRHYRPVVTVVVIATMAGGLLVQGPDATAATGKFVPTRPDLGKPVAGAAWHPAPTPVVFPSDVSPRHLMLDDGVWTVHPSVGSTATTATTTSGGPGTTPAVLAGTWTATGPDGLAIAATKPTGARSVAAAPGKVTVGIRSDITYATGGAAPFALTLTRPAAAIPTPVAVRVPYALLDGLYGADYSAHVTWTTTTDASNVGTTAIASARDSRQRAYVLTVPVGRAPTTITPATQVSASDGSGSFGSTPVNSAASWDVSTQTGAYSWKFPLRTPPAAVGPMPDLALNYDSQAVDGATASTNNQPSVVGEGWDLAGSGFIQRSFVGCAQDDGAGGPVAGSGDLCWHGENATVNFGGHSGLLIHDTNDPAKWRLQTDDGSRFEHMTSGASNGTQSGDYWKLTTRDGTQYVFGENRLPGYTTGNTTTNSTWTVPVYGNDAGEPCHASTFAASACPQAWRWNLDYVVDTHGNAEAFYYTPEGTARYAANGGPTAATYIRGGTLDHIDYGLTSSTVYDTNAASDRVTFGYAARCLPGSTCSQHNATNWPDTPWYLNCTAAPCTEKAPSFWTTKRLSTVTTAVLRGSTYSNVDSWTLAQSYPATTDGTAAAQWLTSIKQTGDVGTTITLPATTFTPTQMANRVVDSKAHDGLAELDKNRIASIRTPTGATVSVNYSGVDCTSADVAAIEGSPQKNNRRCFAQKWTNTAGDYGATRNDLFNIYVTTSVVTSPGTTGGGQDIAEQKNYVYTGHPAWRYDQSPTTPTAERTWSDYAGYDKVEVREGAGASQTATDYLFFQGMNGDRLNPSGGTRNLSVVASDGLSVPDSRWWAGRVRETQQLTGVAGTVLTDTITTPWASPVTSTDGTRTAQFVGDGVVTTIEALADGQTRTSTVTTSHDNADPYGLPQTVEASSDAGTTCTTTAYATANPTAWLIGLPSRVTTVGTTCAAAPTANYLMTGISDTQTSYDHGAPGAAATKGELTQTRITATYTGVQLNTPTWLTTATSDYDTQGRLTSTTDQLNRTTSTSYTPAVGGPLLSKTDTTPMKWSTTTTFDPAWGNVTQVTDPNQNVTTSTYDSLGRRTKVWNADHTQADNPSQPSVQYTYTVSQTDPTTVETTTLIPGYLNSSYQLYDGLGRLRQTQAASEGTGTVATDTNYDASGRVVYATNPYYESLSPSTSLYVPTDSIPSRTSTTYDSAGRKTADILLDHDVEAWRTTFTYSGTDQTDTTPPAGGTPTRTLSDHDGKPVSLTQYLSATPGTGTAEKTTYTYNPHGDMTSMTDPVGNAWTWTYDHRGRKTTQTTPDSGRTVMTYDDADRLITSSDAASNVVTYVYDDADRKTAQYAGTTNGPELASWSYDDLPLGKGLLSSSTRYVGATAGSPGTGTKYTTGTAAAGYDAMGRPLGTTITIPTGTAMAGTYTTSMSWTVTGEPDVQNDPAAGGLPNEPILFSYDSFDEPSSMKSATSRYLSDTTFDHTNRLAQTQQVSGVTVYRTYFRDTGTERLDRVTTERNTAQNSMVSDENLTYDNAGNITEDQDIINTGAPTAATTTTATDTQCFNYDPLGALTEAWTPTANNCATAKSATTLGGPAPYWTSYATDPATGNRTSTTEHRPGSNQVDTYTYPTATKPQPHAALGVVHTGTGAPAADTFDYYANGNTKDRDAQALTWTPDGHLQTVSTGTGANQKTQSDVYDASGNLLVQSDPVSGTTLFLGDTELHQNPGSNVTTGVRTYSMAGVGTLAERTASTATSGSTLCYVDTDAVNTNHADINANDGTIVRRFEDPYGNGRGTAVSWPSTHGYLNAPTNSFAQTVHLGARDYDPMRGQFLSVDPIISPYEPQQNNSFSYSHNSPVARSDPSGMKTISGDGNGGVPDHKPVPPNLNPCYSASGTNCYYNGSIMLPCSDGVAACRNDSGGFDHGAPLGSVEVRRSDYRNHFIAKGAQCIGVGLCGNSQFLYGNRKHQLFLIDGQTGIARQFGCQAGLVEDGSGCTKAHTLPVYKQVDATLDLFLLNLSFVGAGLSIASSATEVAVGSTATRSVIAAGASLDAEAVDSTAVLLREGVADLGGILSTAGISTGSAGIDTLFMALLQLSDSSAVVMGTFAKVLEVIGPPR